MREPATLVIYEAPHRIVDCVEALVAVFEPTRQVVFARELTKMFEEIHRCPVSEALAWVTADQHRERGEFVVLVEGATIATDAQDAEAERILNILLAECSVKQAANLTAQIPGERMPCTSGRCRSRASSRSCVAKGVGWTLQIHAVERMSCISWP